MRSLEGATIRPLFQVREMHVVVGGFVATGCSGVTNAQMTSRVPAWFPIASRTVTLDNVRDNRGAATRTEVGLVSGICQTGFTTSVHPIVIRQTTNEHS